MSSDAAIEAGDARGRVQSQRERRAAFCAADLMARARLEADDIAITHEMVSSSVGMRRSAHHHGRRAPEAGLVCTSRGRVAILDRSGLDGLVDMGGPSGATQ